MFRVASCGSDIQVWNGLNGNNVTLYNTYQGEVFSVSWCHSTNKIVSGNLDGTAHIWLAATGQYVNRLVGHNGAIRSVAWAKDGVHIATASDDKQVGLWLLDTQHNDASSPIFLQKHNQKVYAVNFSDDSQYLVSGSSDRTAMIWHVKDGSYIATYSGHQGEVRTVAFAPGSLPSAGLLIASGSADQSAQVWTWDPVGKEFHLLTRYIGHHATVNTLAWSPDGSRIASGDSAGQVHIWQSQTGAKLLSFQPHQGEVSSLAWSPEGQYLASAGWDQVVHVTRISMPMELPE
jgi:Tol biopolymer transport system component